MLRVSKLLPIAAATLAVLPATAAQPTVGDKAPDFTLTSVAGKTVRLSELTGKGPVALVVLRGFPGYQCPFCNRQAQNFIANAQALSDAGLHIVMVYPGPAQDLGGKANEFLADKKLPENFDFLLDPDYTFTNQYGLRWNASQETAYPSTFLINPNGVVFFSKIVKAHGARTEAAEILEAVGKQKAAGS